MDSARRNNPLDKSPQPLSRGVVFARIFQPNLTILIVSAANSSSEIPLPHLDAVGRVRPTICSCNSCSKARKCFNVCTNRAKHLCQCPNCIHPTAEQCAAKRHGHVRLTASTHETSIMRVASRFSASWAAFLSTPRLTLAYSALHQSDGHMRHTCPAVARSLLRAAPSTQSRALHQPHCMTADFA